MKMSGPIVDGFDKLSDICELLSKSESCVGLVSRRGFKIRSGYRATVDRRSKWDIFLKGGQNQW